MTETANKTNAADNTANNTAVNANALTPEEAKQRLSLERGIDSANKAWYKIGTNAAIIRDLRLYRSTHATGDAYFADRFDYTRQYVAYVIAAARIYDQLKSYGFSVLPKTESQCRPFAKIPEDMQYDANVVLVWQTVVDSGDKMTAKLVTAVVDQVIGEYVLANYPEDSAIYKQWAKAAPKAGSGSSAGAKTEGAASSAGSAGTAGADPGVESEVDQLREQLRAAKAKIAHLESRLASEQAAHKRTAAANGRFAPQSKMATDLYKAGYKSLARQYHPDMGGTAEDMQELDKIKEALGI